MLLHSTLTTTVGGGITVTLVSQVGEPTGMYLEVKLKFKELGMNPEGLILEPALLTTTLH